MQIRYLTAPIPPPTTPEVTSVTQVDAGAVSIAFAPSTSAVRSPVVHTAVATPSASASAVSPVVTGSPLVLDGLPAGTPLTFRVVATDTSSVTATSGETAALSLLHAPTLTSIVHDSSNVTLAFATLNPADADTVYVCEIGGALAFPGSNASPVTTPVVEYGVPYVVMASNAAVGRARSAPVGPLMAVPTTNSADWVNENRVSLTIPFDAVPGAVMYACDVWTAVGTADVHVVATTCNVAPLVMRPLFGGSNYVGTLSAIRGIERAVANIAFRA